MCLFGYEQRNDNKDCITLKKNNYYEKDFDLSLYVIRDAYCIIVLIF